MVFIHPLYGKAVGSAAPVSSIANRQSQIGNGYRSLSVARAIAAKTTERIQKRVVTLVSL